MTASDDQKIAETLVSQGVITLDQLKKAVEFRDSLGGGAIRDLVVKLGYAKDADVVKAIAADQQVGSIEITADMVDVAMMARVPRKIFDKHTVVILRSEDPDKIMLAMADPMDYQATDEIQFLTNLPVEPVVASKSAIRKALQSYVDGAPPSGPEGELAALKDLDQGALLRGLVIALAETGAIRLSDVIEQARKTS